MKILPALLILLNKPMKLYRCRILFTPAEIHRPFILRKTRLVLYGPADLKLVEALGQYLQVWYE